jgi:hypothetical protein
MPWLDVDHVVAGKIVKDKIVLHESLVDEKIAVNMTMSDCDPELLSVDLFDGSFFRRKHELHFCELVDSESGSEFERRNFERVRMLLVHEDSVLKSWMDERNEVHV